MSRAVAILLKLASARPVNSRPYVTSLRGACLVLYDTKTVVCDLSRKTVVSIGIALLLAACGGGGGSGGSGGGSAMPPTIPVFPPTSPILLKQGVVQLTALTLNGTGASFAQTFAASQDGYAGAFTTSGCTSNATTVSSGTNITITGTAAGTCTLTVSNSFNQSATLPITVTVTNVTTQ
jgi:hypothetical protein